MRKLKKATETATESTAAATPMPVTTGPLAFSAPTSDLAALLRRLAGFTDRRSSMPMLACVAIKATATEVTFCATDLNKSAAHVAPSWHVHGTGSAVVNHKALSDVVKKLPKGSTVTIRAHAHAGAQPMLEISCGAIRITMDALHPRDYPKLPPILPDDPVLPLAKVSANQLDAMMDAVKHAICRDETRFHLNGILFESTPDGSRMVATDGHRLAKIEGPALPGFTLAKGIIVPRDAITELSKMLAKGDAEIGLSGKEYPHLIVRQNGTTAAFKQIAADFPPYNQVIPQDNRRLVTIDRVELHAALERAAVVCTETRGVKLECVPEGLKLTADHPDLGTASETIAAELNPAEGFVLGVNANYLLEAISQIDDARVTLAFDHHKADKRRDPTLSPILVRGTEDAAMRPVGSASFLVVIMPMRI